MLRQPHQPTSSRAYLRRLLLSSLAAHCSFLFTSRNAVCCSSSQTRCVIHTLLNFTHLCVQVFHLLYGPCPLLHCALFSIRLHFYFLSTLSCSVILPLDGHSTRYYPRSQAAQYSSIVYRLAGSGRPRRLQTADCRLPTALRASLLLSYQSTTLANSCLSLLCTT